MWSARFLGVPGALAIASSYPLWSTAGAAWWRGDPVSFGQFIGVLLTCVGIIIVVLRAPRFTRSSTVDVDSGFSVVPSIIRRGGKTFSFVLALLTSLMWSINSMAVSELGSRLSPEVSNVLRMGFALIITSVCGRIFLPRASIVLDRKTFTKNIALFVYEAFIGSYLFIIALARSPIAIGVTLSALAPVLAVPVAWISKTERPSLMRTLGVCLVVAGVILLLVY
jgi:drug/metabolite transporter (DMT)-like permease